MPQSQSDLDSLAEETEGARLRALFQDDINQRIAQTPGHNEGAISMLLKAYPLLEGSRRVFIDKSSNYARRKDLGERYSARQITAYAAAETLMPLLDMPPSAFHGVFTACCLAADTHLPEKQKSK